MAEHTLSDAMKRYREGLASRGVRQIQTNLPDAMVDWIDQLGAEKGLNRSSMIEVLCRLGAARLDVALSDESDFGPATMAPGKIHDKADASNQSADTVNLQRLGSVIAVLPPEIPHLSSFLLPQLAQRRHAHVLFVSANGGCPIADRDGITLEWRGPAAIQGHRFNPLSTNIVPKEPKARRLYVRWVSHVLAPDRGDMDTAFPDSTRQLVEETISALMLDGGGITLEDLWDTIEAMPWPPAGNATSGTSGRRVIDMLAATHKGLAPFASRDDKALTGAVEAARDALAPFRTPELRRLTSSDDNILGRFDGRPTVVEVDAGLRTPVSRLATMLVASAIVRRLHTKPYTDQPQLVIALEDFGSLPRIPGLEEAITIGHRHGLAIVGTAHSFRQIEARYGEATALSIQATTHVFSPQPGPDRLLALRNPLCSA